MRPDLDTAIPVLVLSAESNKRTGQALTATHRGRDGQFRQMGLQFRDQTRLRDPVVLVEQELW